MKEFICVWCKREKVKNGFRLCQKCYDLNEEDANRIKNVNYICPICNESIGTRNVCPKCGISRMYLMSLPSHCHICESKFMYEYKGKRRCWCCNAKWKESEIDKMLMFAVNHCEDYNNNKEENKK